VRYERTSPSGSGLSMSGLYGDDIFSVLVAATGHLPA
jgi:hypothetical protein